MCNSNIIHTYISGLTFFHSPQTTSILSLKLRSDQEMNRGAQVSESLTRYRWICSINKMNL